MKSPPDSSEPVLSLGLWRLGIIGELLHADLEGRTRQEILEQLAMRTWVRPDGRNCRFSAETIRKWITRYNVGGLAALEDQPRHRDTSETVPSTLAEFLFEARKAHPRWTVALLIDQARQQQRWDGQRPARATLYRWCRAHNLHRDPHLNPDQTRRAFEFTTFGGLWVADFLHGPRVYVGSERRKVFLHVILDDCTRYVIAARFHCTETTESLITDLHDAIRRFGVPQRFYTDNGPAYHSLHLRQIGARLNIAMPHTPPYQPQGRGKVERFMRHVRERFLAVDRSRTLVELNAALARWIGEHHQNRHEAIQMTPLEKRLAVTSSCRQLPETVDIEQLFTLKRRCRVYLDGTIRIHRRAFEVPQATRGSRTDVFFLPWNLAQVWYGDDHLLAQPLDKHANAARFRDRPMKGQ